MNIYDDKHIKNIVLVGSSKSGKTTLSESMLLEAGLTNRMGSVSEKNTISDYHPIEQERESSVYSTLMQTEWRQFKVNILDTPGLDDFVGEMIASVRVADTAVFTINAQEGIEINTEKTWNYVDQFKKASMFVVNQVDHPKSDFNMALESIKSKFGSAVAQVQYPLNQGDGFNKIIDVLKMKMYVFGPNGGKPQKEPIPDSEMEKANALHNELVEKAAENSEGLMELYFDKGTLNEDEMRQGLKIGMMKHDVFPIFCVSAKNNMGSGRLMGFIDNVAPSAIEALPEHNTKGAEILHQVDAPTELFVYKTLHEPNLGLLSFFKVITGELNEGDSLVNHQTGQTERLGQIFIVDGKKREKIEKLTAGDIGATLKLKNTHTNQTLSAKEILEDVMPMTFPDAKITTAVVSPNSNDEEKFSEAFHKLIDEDPTLSFEYSTELKQMILGAQGELHLNVVKWILKNQYNIEIEFEKPRISYRETIQKSAEAFYRHKKQSGGSGQFAEINIKIEPYFEGKPDPEGYHIRDKQLHDLEWGGKLQFYNCIVGGVIDARYIPSILKGVLEKMANGPLTGSYIRDVRVILFDGKMHPVDSNDMAFKMAGANAFRQAFLEASPQLLEPLYNLEVNTPDDIMGEVMTDLQSRRAMITGMDTNNNYQIIKAKVPLAELDNYVTALRSITQGRASFDMEFAEYAAVNSNLQAQLQKELGELELA
ncbi:MAG: elongation factor G [Bacteroidia bacterium]